MRFWKWVLWIGIGVFLLTRLAVLMAFPVFNDEGIYLQYSQLIHQDFGKYQFVSEGGLYADWKPPLQFWVGALFMGFTSDPLLAGRLAVFLVSLFGLWGLYLFVKELFGKKEADIAVLIYALCPTALFFNVQFVAEAFVIALAPWVYWSFLKALHHERLRPLFGLAAAIFGALLLLSKQSGMVYLGLALLLPFVFFGTKNEKGRKGKWNWRGLGLRLGIVIGGILLAMLFSRLGVSAQSAAVEQKFNSNWLMSVSDLLKFPTAIWMSNFQEIRDYYYSYYSIFVLLPILFFFYVAVRNARRRDFKDVVVGLGFLGGSLAVLLLLKGFNEYIYNTAVIVFLVPLLVRALFQAWEFAELRVRGKEFSLRRAAALLLLLSFVLLAGHWIYQDGLMRAAPARYIERSTPWAIHGYLENWSGGFGVPETIAYLKTLPGPGLVLADPQWGNPRTALEVWNTSYPDLRVIGVTSDFQSPEGTQAAKAYILTQPFKTRLVVFSAATNETRAVWQANIEKYLCTARKEIQVQPAQPPIVICSY